jgi:hypothetical protein
MMVFVGQALIAVLTIDRPDLVFIDIRSLEA